MTNDRWSMNRAGLLNFWYYDEEIFSFADGKLLLRGTNGSGKSVTMQSFLPVLLDGKKTPDRLDPFGSKARRMEDYLLGEKDVVDREERTGYLFLEYKKKGTGQYITTGIGMQAKRNKGIKSWYFVITDNRRIGYDFELSHRHQDESVPYSAKELENRIGAGGQVVHTQRDYMALVNKHVFGFQSIEAYEDLIKLLIQLRSPKLSKDFKPTVIYEILESALPPLTDDELRHLADTIESMDQAQQQIEQLEREHDSAQRLVRQYDLYNRFVVAERVQKWKEAAERHGQAVSRSEQLKKEDDELAEAIRALEEENGVMELQLEQMRDEKARLEKHEVWKLESDKKAMEESIRKLQAAVAALQEKWDSRSASIRKDRAALQQDEDQFEEQKSRLDDLLEELAVDAEEASFHQHSVNEGDFKRHDGYGFEFAVWQKEARAHEELLLEMKAVAEQKDRLMTEHDELQQLSSEQLQKVDKTRGSLRDLENWFTEQQQTLTDDVFRWMESHPNLVFSDSRQQAVLRALSGLYDDHRYEEVREQLMDSLNDYASFVKSNEEFAKRELAAKQAELAQAAAEQQRWRTMTMPQPDRPADTEEFRQRLERQGTAYIPLYAAVEFREGLSDEQKSRVEAALQHTGLLDCLLTEDGSVQPVHDRLFRPEPQLLGHTLADYLRPDIAEDSGISAAFIDEVLRSIPLEQAGGGLQIDEDGSYAVGGLIGHAPEEGPSKFIGRTSRKRFQQEKIEEWGRIAGELKQEADAIEDSLLNWRDEQLRVQEWKASIPSDKALADIDAEIREMVRDLAAQQEQLNRTDAKRKDVHRQLQEAERVLRRKSEGLNIGLTAESLTEAVKAAGSYSRFLSDLKETTRECFHLQKNMQTTQQRIREKEEELDEVKGEENSRTSEIGKAAAAIESIDRQLKLKGVDEIRARIREVQLLLAEAEDRLRTILKELPARSEAKKTVQAKLAEAEKSRQFWLRMSEEWQDAVSREAARNFVEVGEMEPVVLYAQYEPLLSKYDRSKLQEQLTKAFVNEQSDLTEYRMFESAEETPVPDWFAEDWGDYYGPFLDEWRQLRTRRIIHMEYRGQRVSPYVVLDSLVDELANQKSWLDEQDRQLYEDIIVNHVGIILRHRIQRAEKWVKEMDQIMKNRDNSSGLTFSITWKPLTAESEDELDTKDLVQLLQRNSKFLSEEDLNRITRHFQSRITRAKELIQLRSEGSTLQQVLQEVLDYRKWFTFVLSYTRTNEPKRELTNNAFFRFSGGEKAMAMYIPLFTAAYSRYKEAGEMAPFIITLDEAFAGVDEQNIRDMFEVVEQLGFDYIMNSQALWGDYDTISNLAICELIRPKNASFVTVMRYLWDGRTRTEVKDGDSDEITDDNAESDVRADEIAH
ncbi:TIGR02680 family protein [Sporosarcina sp. NCCP-2716]|uniref:TIGR02680 family protein n=1 Tax=Sporosarcina sp. NCCP-2716 TaxID=2943679 RepID=UPI002040CF3E|nr:TIGR02680 family protein [Sporosarcina sp. NCCP-2716]GKV69727.1 TIGR02680 family protein [Sporosarcina sp. NCCP-2716]